MIEIFYCSMLGCFQTPRAKPLEDFRSQEDNITTSGSVLASGFPLLDCVHNDSDHPATRTSLTAAMLDYPAAVGPNKLPVCSSEVVTSDELTTGNVEASDECSEKEETTKNDDVIRTCVTESGDAAVCVVEVEKGELGLGFCLQGGKGSVAGDRPLSVKKLFRGRYIILLVYVATRKIFTSCSFTRLMLYFSADCVDVPGGRNKCSYLSRKKIPLLFLLERRLTKPQELVK